MRRGIQLVGVAMWFVSSVAWFGASAGSVVGAVRDVAAVAPAGLPSVAGAETLVFSSLRTGNGDLYSVHPDGSGLTRLTSSTAMDASPALSPDGTRVAFVSTRDGNAEIYTMRLDGSGLVRLTNNRAIDAEPDWSPDGQRIVFTSGRTGNGDIYSMSATDGTGLTRLTTDSAVDASPAWSPDGMRIAFSSLRSGAGDIYRMQADGTLQTRLTTSIAADLFPAWSPDGQRLAFASLRSGNSDIYAMKPDGSAQTRITTAGAVETEPTWSPDGARLAISSNAAGGLNFDLRLINADGSGGTPLATNPAIDAAPDWAGPTFPPLSSIVVTSTPDIGHRASRLVSAALGGVLETDGADGTHYRLVVPAGALAADTTISIAPTLVSGLGALATAAPYAVEFGPSGLTFSTPATLTITPPVGGPPPGNFVVRWSGPSGVELGILTKARDGSVIVSVPHFSGEATIQAVQHSYAQMLVLALAAMQIPSTSQLGSDVLAVNGPAAVADLVSIYQASVVPSLLAVHGLSPSGDAEAAVVAIGTAEHALQEFGGLQQMVESQIPSAGQLTVPNTSPPQTLDAFVASGLALFINDATLYETHYTDPECDGSVTQLADWIVVPIDVESDINFLNGGAPNGIDFCVVAGVDTLAFPATLEAAQQTVDGKVQGGVLAPPQTPGGLPAPGAGPKLFPQATTYHLDVVGAVFGDGSDTMDATSGPDGLLSFQVDRGADQSQRAPRVTVSGNGEVGGFWADVERAVTIDPIVPIRLSAGPANAVDVAFRSPPLNDILQPGATTHLCVDVADAEQTVLASLPVNWSLDGGGSLSDTTTLSDGLGIACVDYHDPAGFVVQGDTSVIKAEATHNGATGSDSVTLTPAWASIVLEARPVSATAFVPATNTTVNVPAGDQVQLRVTVTVNGATVADPPAPCASCALDVSIANGGGQFIDTPSAPATADVIALDDTGQALMTWDPGSFSGETQLQFLVNGVAATVTLKNPITVSLTPAVIVLGPGQPATFAATVYGSANQAVVWSATGGTITQSGDYIAGPAGGPFTVTATSVADPTASASAIVGISGGGGPNDVPQLGHGFSFKGQFTDVTLGPDGQPLNHSFDGTANVGNFDGTYILGGTSPLSFFNPNWTMTLGGTDGPGAFTAVANGCCNPNMGITGSIGGGVITFLMYSMDTGERLWTFSGTLDYKV